MVDNSVKGKTAVYGVIGCPIEHTFSPAYSQYNGKDFK